MAPRHSFWAAWMMVLLLVPAAMWLGGRYPNENIADAPGPADVEWEPERLLDEDYYREVDARLERRLPVRGVGRWLLARIDYGIFHDTTTPEVTVGAGSWLYTTAYLEMPCDELEALEIPPTPDVAAGRIHVVITVPKATLHPEPIGGVRPCAEAARRAWRERVAEDPRFLDVNGTLEANRARRPELEVFFRQDSRWTPPARQLVARRIVDGIQPGLWDPEAVESAPGAALRLDLLEMIGIVEQLPVVEHDINRGNRVLTVETEVDPDTGVRRRLETVTTGRVVPGTTVMIGDDQLAFVLPYLTAYFERLAFLHWDEVETGTLPAALAADRIVIQTIESEAATRLAPDVLDAIVVPIVDG